METQPVTLIPALPPPAAAGSSKQSNQQLVFDFTKRKRWADLLVSELKEAIMLVLSDSGVVWYCGPAVEDLLGWADEELVDGSLADIMNEEDRAIFERQFAESVQNRTDLLSYARLRCKSENDIYGPNLPIIPNIPDSPQGSSHASQPARKEVLFEIKGYPHFVISPTLVHTTSAGRFDLRDLHTMSNMDSHAGPSSSSSHSDNGIFKCFFAMAKPYPSRNTAMLNTFLELKMENERLQQRLRDAKAEAEALDRAEAQRRALSPYVSPHQTPYPGPLHGRAHTAPTSQSFAWTLNSTAGGAGRAFDSRTFYPSFADAVPGSSSSALGAGTSSAHAAAAGEHADPAADPSLPRKKNKKSTAPDMYCCMTCGRTDSPEWRKGPQGPKTLCNACGLRWAKTVRRDHGSAAQGDNSNDG